MVFEFKRFLVQQHGGISSSSTHCTQKHAKPIKYGCYAVLVDVEASGRMFDEMRSKRKLFKNKFS